MPVKMAGPTRYKLYSKVFPFRLMLVFVLQAVWPNIYYAVRLRHTPPKIRLKPRILLYKPPYREMDLIRRFCQTRPRRWPHHYAYET